MVIRAFNAHNGTEVKLKMHFHSLWMPNFTYKIGMQVSVEDFSDDIRVECAPGIHFFLTFDEARDYTL
jgi:hypothetical protein